MAGGYAALDALAEHTFDLVLMDIQMPGLDGLEATRRIRACAASTRDVCVVALAAHAMKEDRLCCLEAGADEYVSKPVDFNALLGLIERLLSGPRKKADAPPVDLAGLLRNMQGRPDKVEAIVAHFLDDQEGKMHHLREAAARSEREAVARQAHGLKSGLGYLGAARARAGRSAESRCAGKHAGGNSRSTRAVGRRDEARSGLLDLWRVARAALPVWPRSALPVEQCVRFEDCLRQLRREGNFGLAGAKKIHSVTPKAPRLKRSGAFA